uniref:hypothetical protein n=1 Tax=Enterobacter sp. JH586 TaxID=2923094 RepID=UPI00208E0A44
ATSFWLSGAPRSARMLARSMGDTHLAFYFSPGAVRIFDIGLSRWSAAPCEAPVDGDLTLVVGHAEPTLQA